jgi:hypothetical protein
MHVFVSRLHVMTAPCLLVMVAIASPRYVKSPARPEPFDTASVHEEATILWSGFGKLSLDMLDRTWTLIDYGLDVLRVTNEARFTLHKH